ncbi:Endonuclease YncB, thermonuclease family [Cnuella takakiae]|uniref:Endonuclease YncB, thermonuclease family n=2 Tax=Cnuella takakiae TaxID=1302690 RepID=A0A1M4V9Z1_9BACT|nr:hypothetical protein BUE76_12755 [Cnuella takakiae]SHE65821.1 Endonuclease YncB, thermonuclease family [Cnuella takakiae]
MSVSRVLFCCLLFACNSSNGDQNMGQVVKIADGDTFTLLMAGNQQVKVRLYGIDCPEKAQPYGKAAGRVLGALMEGHRVRIEEKDKDRYGRTIAVAFLDDGRNINETMLAQGYAWHYIDFDKNPAWSALEAKARDQRLGLWKESNPVAPWEFRSAKRARSKNPKGTKPRKSNTTVLFE